MKLTKAQDALLRQLENGFEVTFKDGHYTVVGRDHEQKIWPTTFYGLFDAEMVVKTSNGNYTISDNGIRKIRSKNE